MNYLKRFFFFFFQAEDGIRDGHVTGVQTCALPISGSDFGVVLYTALAVAALLDWTTGARESDLRRAAITAGLAGGCKLMGLLVPALVGVAVLGVLLWRSGTV